MSADYYSTYNLFHGTTMSSLEKILSERNFTFENRNDHWIGNGVYFFVDDPSKAKWWAKQACKKASRSESVIHKQAVIFLEGYSILRSKVIDLDTEYDRIKIRNFIKYLEGLGTVIKTIGSDEDQKMNQKRCQVIDIFVAYYDIYASKKTFYKEELVKDKEIYEHGISNNEIQFCIFNQNTIDFDKVSRWER